MCLRGVFWRWMAMNRAQVAAIERGLCGSLPQRRALTWHTTSAPPPRSSCTTRTLRVWCSRIFRERSPGSRVVVNFFGGRRQKMTLGFPLHLSKLELSEAFREHYLADLKRIPPRYVDDGPVFENVITGDAVDVTMFPTPKWHPEDGGRYIGTGSFNVTRDPDEGWINCGTYRVMIHDDKTVGFYPWHWRDKFPKVNAPSREAARLARQRFGYLLK
jgi:3-octaprenyl-4-hydroxybenzoate carboxy-lyase